MKRPIIIEGRPFDWDAGREALDNAVSQDGEINWRAAFSADPGVLSCPFCDERMWWEGTVVECPSCGQRFNTNWRDVARKATGRDPVSQRISNSVHANIVRILEDAYKQGESGLAVKLPADCPPLIRGFVQFVRRGLMSVN